MPVEAKLKELNLTLPAAPKPIAAYVPAVRSGNLLFISGQLPMRNGEMMHKGKCSAHVTIADAQHAAQQCVLNALAIIKDHIAGDWSKLVRIVKVEVFVASGDNFFDQPKVANGASELLVRILGEPGKHARAAVGVNSLPLDAPVEVTLIAELR
ncbi:MAG: RidA family protein [Phycisphaeraceae bacterium]